MYFRRRVQLSNSHSAHKHFAERCRSSVIRLCHLVLKNIRARNKRKANSNYERAKNTRRKALQKGLALLGANSRAFFARTPSRKKRKCRASLFEKINFFVKCSSLNIIYIKSMGSFRLSPPSKQIIACAITNRNHCIAVLRPAYEFSSKTRAGTFPPTSPGAIRLR